MKNLDTIIENYLAGNLPADEVSKFEQFLSQNPDAQSQLDFQKDIIEGIKEMRRKELKTKLSSIDPKAASSSIMPKIAIAATTLVGTAIVSVAIYMTSYNSEETNPSKNDTVNHEEVSSVLETQPNTSNNEEISINELAQEDEKVNIIDQEGPSVNVPTVNNVPDVSVVEGSNDNPTVVAPSRPDMFIDEEISDDPEHGNIEEPNAINSGQNVIGGSTLSYSIDADCKSDENGYTYSNMKLQLCGDFKKSEFTIYKDAVEGNFYFQYENNYYKIVESNSFEKFSENKLTSSKIIKRLK